MNDDYDQYRDPVNDPLYRAPKESARAVREVHETLDEPFSQLSEPGYVDWGDPDATEEDKQDKYTRRPLKHAEKAIMGLGVAVLVGIFGVSAFTGHDSSHPNSPTSQLSARPTASVQSSQTTSDSEDRQGQVDDQLRSARDDVNVTFDKKLTQSQKMFVETVLPYEQAMGGLPEPHKYLLQTGQETCTALDADRKANDFQNALLNMPGVSHDDEKVVIRDSAAEYLCPANKAFVDRLDSILVGNTYVVSNHLKINQSGVFTTMEPGIWRSFKNVTNCRVYLLDRNGNLQRQFGSPYYAVDGIVVNIPKNSIGDGVQVSSGCGGLVPDTAPAM